MIWPTVSTIGTQQVEKALRDLQKKLDGSQRVLVGVPSGAGAYEDGLTIATIAAVNEFGAKDIQHKGGVSYGYKTEKDAIAGKVRFLKQGEGFMELGKTGAHTGSIPARPFLRPGVENVAPALVLLAEVQIPKVLSGEFTMHQILQQIGQMAEDGVRTQIDNVKEPPNAKSTIRKKGSDKPLIEDGHLRQSIRYVIGGKDEPIEEGI